MAMNPLAIEPVTKDSQEANPLMRAQRSAPPQMTPMHAHAKVWQHVNSMPKSDIPDAASRTDYLLPIIGKLAGNPKTTAKDVIKAAANAAADNQIEPSEAVTFIQQIPEKPEALRSWLRGLYAINMMGAVHMKAAMAQQQAPAQPAQVPAPQPAAPNPAIPGVPA